MGAGYVPNVKTFLRATRPPRWHDRAWRWVRRAARCVGRWFVEWWRCPFRVILAALLAACLAPGQGVRVVFDDGTMTDQIGLGWTTAAGLDVVVSEPVPGRFRVRLHNRGKPEWQINSPQAGRRVFLRDVYLGVPPGYEIEWAGPKEATDAGFDLIGLRVWHVLGPQHRRSVFPLIPESKSKHIVTGGESVTWDLVAGTPPRPPRAGQDAEKARALLWWHPGYSGARWPEQDRLSGLWRITPASFDPAAPDRDMGWRMRWWARRFSGNADGTTRVPAATGPFDWGGMQWPDGHSAAHYDPARWAVDLYLRTGDPGAWDLAYLLVRHWADQSFIWTDYPEPQVQHAVRYEKGHMAPGELGRPGNAGDSPPRISHMWDTGARLVAHLSGDKDLLEVCRLRGEYVLRSRPALTPNGCRGFAWNLENATAHGFMTGDPRFRVHVEAEITRALAAAWPLGKVAPNGVQLPAWPSERTVHVGGVEWDPWQHAIALAAIVQASGILDFDMQPTTVATLVEIGTHVLERGTRFTPGPSGPQHHLQGCMFRDREYSSRWPDQLLEVWQGPALSANFLPLLWIAASHDPVRWGERWRACARTCGELCFTGFGQPWPPPQIQRQADSNYWGLAGEKAMADLMFARPWFMVPPTGVPDP